MEDGAYLSMFGGLVTGSSLTAVFAIMLLKEIGVPVPIPIDLVVIAAGVQAAMGQYTLLELALALEAAVFVGCSAKFLLARGVGRQIVYRWGRFIGLTPARLDRAAAHLQRRGPLAVFLGLNVPGMRTGTTVAAGLAGMRYVVFAPAMVAGSTLFYGWHVALGYLIGPTATHLLETANAPLVLVVIGLAIVGLIGWLVLRRRRREATPAASPEAAPVHAWTEAACPACLTVTTVQVRTVRRAGA